MSHAENIYYRLIMHSCRIFVVAVFVLFISVPVLAQQPETGIPVSADSTVKLPDTKDSSVIALTDSTRVADSTATTTDSATAESKEKELGIKISKDALPATVTTTAKDSAVL